MAPEPRWDCKSRKNCRAKGDRRSNTSGSTSHSDSALWACADWLSYLRVFVCTWLVKLVDSIHFKPLFKSTQIKTNMLVKFLSNSRCRPLYSHIQLPTVDTSLCPAVDSTSSSSRPPKTGVSHETKCFLKIKTHHFDIYLIKMRVYIFVALCVDAGFVFSSPRMDDRK